MPLDQKTVNKLFVRLRSPATTTFKDFVEIRKVSMIVTFETTFTSHHAPRATFLPLIVKHRITNLL